MELRTTDQYQKIMDYRNLFGGPVGQRVLEDMRRKLGRQTSYVPGSFDGTAFREGKRTFLIDIERMLAMRDDELEAIKFDGPVQTMPDEPLTHEEDVNVS